MATLQADDIGDLVTTTQRDLGRMRWVDIVSELQDHIAMKELIRSERVGFSSGYGIQFNVMVQESGAAKNVGLYEVDNVNVADVMITGNIPWRHTTTNYAIERRELAMNRAPARLVELIKIRRTDAMISLAELMEGDFWADPAADGLSPFGIFYWIPKSTSATNEGFFGSNPTNFTAGAAGIDADTYTRWRSYNVQYVNVSKTDLVRKWRRAATFTNFKSAVPQPDYNRGNRYGYYTNYSVIGPLEEALEHQNDNLGNDIASKDGMLIFRQVPVQWVPKLEDETDNPVLGINWGVFKPVFLSGEYLREEGPNKASNQHTVFQTHVDLTYNFVCYDRRRTFCLNTA